jgi:hypothetical protein
LIEQKDSTMRILALTGIALALVIGPAYAADQASCDQMFEKADANKDGTVGGPEVTAFAEAYKTSAGISGGEGGDTELTIAKEQFSEACMKDAFKDVQMPM